MSLYIYRNWKIGDHIFADAHSFRLFHNVWINLYSDFFIKLLHVGNFNLNSFFLGVWKPAKMTTFTWRKRDLVHLLDFSLRIPNSQSLRVVLNHKLWTLLIFILNQNINRTIMHSSVNNIQGMHTQIHLCCTNHSHWTNLFQLERRWEEPVITIWAYVSKLLLFSVSPVEDLPWIWIYVDNAFLNVFLSHLENCVCLIDDHIHGRYCDDFWDYGAWNVDLGKWSLIEEIQLWCIFATKSVHFSWKSNSINFDNLRRVLSTNSNLYFINVACHDCYWVFIALRQDFVLLVWNSFDL